VEVSPGIEPLRSFSNHGLVMTARHTPTGEVEMSVAVSTGSATETSEDFTS
jgi:hypothetical protein